MKIDPTLYEHSRGTIQFFSDKYIDLPFGKLCSIISVSTHVPIFAVAKILEQIRGESEESKITIQEIKDFYKYED